MAEYKCADCGKPLNVINYVRPVPFGMILFDRPPLCKDCWQKECDLTYKNQPR